MDTKRYLFYNANFRLSSHNISLPNILKYYRVLHRPRKPHNAVRKQTSSDIINRKRPRNRNRVVRSDLILNKIKHFFISTSIPNKIYSIKVQGQSQIPVKLFTRL